MSDRRVWFVGQGRWSHLLARAINDYGSGQLSARCLGLDSAGHAHRVTSLLNIGSHDVVVRVGFRPGARTWRGVGFDVVWLILRLLRPKAKFVVYWIGTDVLNAVSDVKDRRLQALRFVAGRSTTHLAGAPWLVEELAGIGVSASFVPLPWLYAPVPARPAPFPGVFTILTYIPDSRPEFYGRSMILSAAKILPDARFVLVGGTGVDVAAAPDNVEFAGWVDSMDDVYRSASVVVRMVAHDAIGGTVLEGLAYARHVVYTYGFPFTTHVRFGNTSGLCAVLLGLKCRWDAGELLLNLDGRDYVMANYQPDVAAVRLEAELSFVATP